VTPSDTRGNAGTAATATRSSARGHAAAVIAHAGEWVAAAVAHRARSAPAPHTARGGPPTARSSAAADAPCRPPFWLVAPRPAARAGAPDGTPAVGAAAPDVVGPPAASTAQRRGGGGCAASAPRRVTTWTRGPAAARGGGRGRPRSPTVPASTRTRRWGFCWWGRGAGGGAPAGVPTRLPRGREVVGRQVGAGSCTRTRVGSRLASG